MIPIEKIGLRTECYMSSLPASRHPGTKHSTANDGCWLVVTFYGLHSCSEQVFSTIKAHPFKACTFNAHLYRAFTATSFNFRSSVRL